ncbi:MAG: 1-acyl-sn-glycerol-3-phosphate acyltransferase [bacterium]|nr:1-acyl-sn-glycerol-3-phosphate acyltransferase [bacterium]
MINEPSQKATDETGKVILEAEVAGDGATGGVSVPYKETESSGSQPFSQLSSEASLEEENKGEASLVGGVLGNIKKSVPDSLRHTALAKVCFEPPDFKQIGYRFARPLVELYYRLLYGIDVEGLENIPPEGGCLVASNHVSLLDPPLVAAVIKNRQVHFIAKKELFEIPIMGRIIASFGCVFVDRAAKDGKSVNQAIDLLKNGRLVGIFPEGTRSKTGKLQRGRLGTAVMALKTGAPVIPACVFNTFEIGHRHGLPCGRRLGVRFGKAIEVPYMENPDPKSMKSVCNQIMEAIAELQNRGPVK